MEAPVQSVFDFYRGQPARPKRPERLFFGALVDTETAIWVRQFTDEFVCTNHMPGSRIGMERLHVSLHHVGDFKRLPPKVIYAAVRAGKAVSACSFEVTFRFVGSFEGAPSIDGRPRRHPFVLLGESDALRNLHRALGAAMEKNGFRATEYFVPHMTLLYGPDMVPFHPIEPIRFVVQEFVLIHSERWLTRYNILGRWPLRH